MTADNRAAKRALRARILTTRGELSAHALAVAARELRDVLLDVDEVRKARRVAAYVSVGREPGTGPLIEALTDNGAEVIVPLVQHDGELDWARYEGPHSLVSAPFGLLEPTSAPLGPPAVLDTDVVLVPALAVDRRGVRLGKGGGYYDRVLARLAGQSFSCALVHDGELLDMPVPRDVHDVPVAAVATTQGVFRTPTSPSS